MQTIQAFSNGCKFRIKLTIQASKVAGSLTDYPFYINLAGLGNNFWLNVLNGGGDIRITTENGTTECPREVVSCNTSTKQGEVHVLIPTVSSTTNTNIYLYFGNPTGVDYAITDTYGAVAVWKNYALVAHLENKNLSKPASAQFTEVGSPTYISGILGKGLSLNATGSHLSLTNVFTSFAAQNWVIQEWFKQDALLTGNAFNDQIGLVTNANVTTYLLHGLRNSNITLRLVSGGFDQSTSLTQIVGSFYAIRATLTGARAVNLKKNNTSSASVTLTADRVDLTSTGMTVGNMFAAALSLNRVYDEVRISNTIQSENYYTTEYNNQNDYSSFYVAGSLEVPSLVFNTVANASIRQISQRVFMAFPKGYNPALAFQNTQPIGSIPYSSGIQQEWDKYQYTDYSARVMSVEWSRGVDPVASVAMAIADVTFDNHDDFFTPGEATSPLSNYILPKRPIRIFAGFAGDVVPVFVGLTESMPEIDQKHKTARFHCIDYLSALLSRPLDQTFMLQDNRTDQILSALFVDAGLLGSQLSLDYGSNRPPFFYAEKGEKLGSVIKKLMIAEQGRLYLSEVGVITFKTRSNYNSNTVYDFGSYTNLVSHKTKKKDDVINVVTIKGNIRSVKPKQKYFELSAPVLIPANTSKDLWIEFNDPVTSVDTPLYDTLATTSKYTTNTQEDGSGVASSSLSLGSPTLFGPTYKMPFTNVTSTDIWIFSLILYCTPATISENIYIREQDDSSVDLYEEQTLDIQSDLYGSKSDAQSKALVLLNDYADFGTIQTTEVKGNPALQLDDQIRINSYGNIGVYKITKITNEITNKGKYEQNLEVKVFNPITFFTIGVSAIGGTDQISP